MPRLSYPADWENFAVYFARVRRTSNLSAAGIAKRLEDDGSVQRFELQSLVPLGGHAGHTRVSKMEVCDCGGLWIRTRFGWHQAGDFEIRYHPPTHRLRFELMLRPADGDDDDDETKPVAPIVPVAPVAPMATAGETPLKTGSVEATEAMRQQRTLEPAIAKWLREDMATTVDGKPFLYADVDAYRAPCGEQFPGVRFREFRRALTGARKQLGLVKPRIPSKRKARP